MSKKARKSEAVNAKRSQGLSRRKLILLPAVALAIGTTAFGLNALETGKRELHDLAVIGDGKPALVQIHDPGCPTCRRLRNIVKNAVGSDDSINYRLADITSAEGKALQEKYGVPHVTLLYFDGEGKHVYTTQGLQEKDSIKANIEQYLR